ncbi:hypothetical protein KL918_004633 [Ogataea parapolymorpha]|uniref:U1 small nuclear ribonucleoprotein component SNU71 n=1 Tax=Ogataea parapolymorpha (strain ATCC 26012 / BCRC 20466 / JCM 22074 / NRRL Y-7560 / DL-1) TaxID=871575 RepID=W1QKH6_OGAPD|nr:hypothetical protein HPODL_00082 [Ogataea parapolymorpha DL-1]ESX03587.1 hypothetical protein HPODL_00082 [Ogataea parapolymorpha DL-1]KAG7865391.1 hypothetical protein KL918_004633 [Ogataea parapolymorpha]KAG7873836.1 hypothetical protein KL916_001996 [Ogataea parapolymorpha]
MFRTRPINESELDKRREKDLKEFNFPKLFNKEVDYAKVDRPALESYIEQKMNELVPDDDIIVEFTNNLVFDEKISPKDLCLQLKPMLDEKTVDFVHELWKKMIESEQEKKDTYRERDEQDERRVQRVHDDRNEDRQRRFHGKSKSFKRSKYKRSYHK